MSLSMECRARHRVYALPSMLVAMPSHGVMAGGRRPTPFGPAAHWRGSLVHRFTIAWPSRLLVQLLPM